MQLHDRRMLPGRVVPLGDVDVVGPNLAVGAGVREDLPSLGGVGRITPSPAQPPLDVPRVRSRGADGRDRGLAGGGINRLEEGLEQGPEIGGVSAIDSAQCPRGTRPGPASRRKSPSLGSSATARRACSSASLRS